MRVAVIGAGISGLAAATVLAKAGVEVVVYEKEDCLGGNFRTATIHGVDLDLDFMAFNRVTFPNITKFLETLGVDMEPCDISFSVSLDSGKGYEWGSRNGLSSLFAQRRNILNPYYWKMLQEVANFEYDVTRYLEDLDNNPDNACRSETLGHFVNLRGYSKIFQKVYLVPICASVWSCSTEALMGFSAYLVLSFCKNNNLLQIFNRPKCLVIKKQPYYYADKVREELERKNCQIRCSSMVQSISKISTAGQVGCIVACEDGSQDMYSGSIIATNTLDALKMLGSQASHEEVRLLGAFQYDHRLSSYAPILVEPKACDVVETQPRYLCLRTQMCDIFLHGDKSLMPQNSAAWSAWNSVGTVEGKVCLTYWLNVLQNLGVTELPYLVTLNPPRMPENTLLKWSACRTIPSVAALKASLELEHTQGKRGIWFCGAYQGCGFHADGLKAGLVAAYGMLGKSCAILNNPKYMLPSIMEKGARILITRFLRNYISVGCLTILEEGGASFNFEGNTVKCHLKASIKVHNPQFYWKVATQADLGLADAYVNGDFSVINANEGLQDLFMIFIANRELKTSLSRLNRKRGWWTPLLFTAGITSAKCFFQHVLKQNTLTQARRNISHHYDLGNEVFSLFMDETMQYSSGLFKSEDEDLKVAQMRKISLLIEKARIDKKHEILELGSGWGTFAIEVVKRTGCKYTGITLSEEQLNFAEMKVKEAGLQDNIRFLLCDYRQLPATYKYDRIIACEILEHVGHEYYEDFFNTCESVLEENGLLVTQFTSIPDDRYDAYRRSSDFIKEYVFPGGSLPSFSRITTAMAASSRLCVENLENIGIHYYRTLRCWRKNFSEQQSKIIELGFDDKFIRTWEYYFDYCAAGLKTRTLASLQVVFSRPGNVKALGSPDDSSTLVSAVACGSRVLSMDGKSG